MRYLPILAVAALLATGCSFLPGPPPQVPDPAPPPPPPPTVTPVVIAPPAEAAPPPPPPPSPPPAAITEALIDEARILDNAGSPTEAAATIEQAIHIEPRRGELWLQLAELRLREGRAAMAEQSARKALLFLRPDSPEERQAWVVIADARDAQGDHETAAGIRNRWSIPNS